MISQIERRMTQFGNPLVLTAKHLYILPSKLGWIYALILVSISIGAINYQLNAGILFTLLMIMVGLIVMWESHQNLLGIRIQCLPVQDTQQNQPLHIKLFVQSETLPRSNIRFLLKQCEAGFVQNLQPGKQIIKLALKTTRRGEFFLPTIQIISYSPMGLFRVWAYLNFEVSYFVYPLALNPGYWPSHPSLETHSDSQQVAFDEEEFYELKEVQNPWIQPGRIAWKSSARDQNWLLKTFVSPTSQAPKVFHLHDSTAKEIETRLQHLSYWLQESERQGVCYGLQLTNQSTIIARGAQHLKQCLRQLAVF